MGTRLHRDDPRRPPTLAQRFLEDALGEDLKSILLRLLPFYSQEEIGKMFGIHHSTVSRWLHRLGINRAPDGRTWWEVRKKSRMRIRGGRIADNITQDATLEGLDDRSEP